MSKVLTVEFPEMVEDVEEAKEKLIKEFYDKVILPFNKFFEGYGEGFYSHCELTQECSEPWNGEVAWGHVRSPFIDPEQNDIVIAYVTFFFDGTARITYEESNSKKSGTWQEIMAEMLEIVRGHLEQLQDTTRIQKLAEAMAVLSSQPIKGGAEQEIY